MDDKTKSLLEYSGSRVAMAELMGAVSFDASLKIANSFVNNDEMHAFENGIYYTFQHEKTLPEPKGGKKFYNQLCKIAHNLLYVG